jgi:hypothetical protein
MSGEHEVTMNSPVKITMNCKEIDGSTTIYRGTFSGTSAACVEEYFEQCATECEIEYRE